MTSPSRPSDSNPSLEQVNQYSNLELSAIIKQRPEVINHIVNELMQSKHNITKFPQLTAKVIQAISTEDALRSEGSEKLFQILKINSFLGLDKNAMLSEAIKNENLILAAKLIEMGATIDPHLPVTDVTKLVESTLDSGMIKLFEACLDYFLEYHPEVFKTEETEPGIFEFAFNNPNLSDCKLIIKSDENGQREVWINRKLLSLPRGGISRFDHSKLTGTEMEIYHENPDILIELLRFSYDGTVSIDRSNVEQLLHAAYEYKVAGLKKQCEQWIINNLTVADITPEHLLELSDSCSSEPLRSYANTLLNR